MPDIHPACNQTLEQTKPRRTEEDDILSVDLKAVAAVTKPKTLQVQAKDLKLNLNRTH